MATTIAVSAASTLLVAFGLFGVWALFVSRSKPDESTSKRGSKKAPTPYLEELAGRIASIEVAVAGLPSLWQEERERAKKFNDRALEAERRTAALLEGDRDELDAEEQVEFLQELDEHRSPEGGVLPMHAGMEQSDADAERNALAVAALAIVGR